MLGIYLNSLFKLEISVSLLPECYPGSKFYSIVFSLITYLFYCNHNKDNNGE